MKTDWNYTQLAEAYLLRPDYSLPAINALLDAMSLPGEARICDVGAGVAHLTRLLAGRGYAVDAIEPNDRMRALGQEQTRDFPAVAWYEGTGEATGRPAHSYHLVTFGSSFNVTDRSLALAETRRILIPGGWFACMWNHRDLEDPLQAGIEALIQEQVPGYRYGTRREDQRQFLEQSGYFEAVLELSGRVLHHQSLADCLTAWRSHATLARQAGERFERVLSAIDAYLQEKAPAGLNIPYTTRIWFGRFRT